jgi:N-formylglutamate amidohydrolase
MTPFDAIRGDGPVILGQPHGGLWLPDALKARHHSQPGESVHAIQMELTQRAYLAEEAAPWAYHAAKAGALRATLSLILSYLDRLARSGSLASAAT